MRALSLLKTAATVAVLAVPVLPVQAETNSGAYLAGRAASFGSDYEAAALYYTRALVRDPSNVNLMENAVTAYLGLGDVDTAAPIAMRMVQAGENNQIANLVLLAQDAKNGNWTRLIENLDAGQSVGPLYDGLLRAWALVGQGRMSDALTQFDEVAQARGVQAFGLFHKALALASVGDFESASAILEGTDGPSVALTRRGVLAQLSILSHLDRHQDALDLLPSIFGAELDPALVEMRALLEAGEVIPFDAVRSPLDGAAEVHYSIASALNGEAADNYTLVYARTAAYLRPDHIDAVLLGASMLERLGRYELAGETFDQVPFGHPAYHTARLGRAGTLSQLDQPDQAVAVLTELTETHGSLPSVQMALADTLRRNERFAESIAPYTQALELLGEPAEGHWSLYFSRGISYEREDRWDEAEADFRKALELRPDQPQVLNYLGYSFVEMQTNLDEALDMIERAVAAQPESGYITDSLGWVYYRLGRYEEAVAPMERAVELLPVDPIINDHLGDVYWAVGREREAEFQWLRALSFDPEPEEQARIRRKLEVGLDVVLEEEGAEPLRVANDDG